MGQDGLLLHILPGTWLQVRDLQQRGFLQRLGWDPHLLRRQARRCHPSSLPVAPIMHLLRRGDQVAARHRYRRRQAHHAASSLLRCLVQRRPRHALYQALPRGNDPFRISQ